MKAKLPVYFILFQLIIFSCSENNEQNPCLESNIEMSCECASNEIYTVVEEKPTFGNDGSDLLDYFLPLIEIIGIDDVDNGEIKLRLVISDEGKPCLADIFETNAPEQDFSYFFQLINQMPNWTEGKQRGISRFVYINVIIKIINGEIESILQEG